MLSYATLLSLAEAINFLAETIFVHIQMEVGYLQTFTNVRTLPAE